MPELVTVPISFFEITVAFERPVVRILGDKTALMEAVMSAWAPFHLSVDDIDNLTGGKLSEHGLLFKLPSKQIAFFVGATYCRFSRGAVSWELAEETKQVFELSLKSLADMANVALGKQQTVVGMHVQPKVKPFTEILRPFLAPAFAGLESGALRTAAVIGRWDDRAVTLDGSGSLANGVYIKMERTFPAVTSFEDILDQLFKDQEQLYALMDIEEERA